MQKISCDIHARRTRKRSLPATRICRGRRNYACVRSRKNRRFSLTSYSTELCLSHPFIHPPPPPKVCLYFGETNSRVLDAAHPPPSPSLPIFGLGPYILCTVVVYTSSYSTSSMAQRKG